MLVREQVRAVVGGVEFGPLGSRLIVEEDGFKSGYECSGCAGTGTAKCGACDGTGSRGIEGSPTRRTCGECGGSGAVKCGECAGSGGLLAIPEESQRRPTTGIVRGVGTECTLDIAAGDRVLYGVFAGFGIDLKGITVRFLDQGEVIATVSKSINRLSTVDFTAAV